MTGAVMAKFPEQASSGNGTPKIWGIPLTLLVSVFQSVGVPTLLLGVIVYGAWRYLPPVVDGHLKLLLRTSETLDSMDKTLKQSTSILHEINTTEQQTKGFMEKVEKDHRIADEKHDKILQQTSNGS
jgi:hypothetical protein